MSTWKPRDMGDYQREAAERQEPYLDMEEHCIKSGAGWSIKATKVVTWLFLAVFIYLVVLAR